MTNSNDRDIPPVIQSLFTLRDSIDAISCAADLMPDTIDDSGLAFGTLFKILSERLQNDCVALTSDILNLDEKIAQN